MEALQAQLEEQTRLAKEQVEALLEDRKIKTEEAQAQQRRDQERIAALNDKLVETDFPVSPETRLRIILDSAFPTRQTPADSEPAA